MNYLTNYYKNLCEQLEAQISILEMQLNEAGLKKALKRKDMQSLGKEIVKGYERRKRAQGEMEASDVSGAMQTYGASSQEAARAKAKQDMLQAKIGKIDLNLNALEDAELNNLSPNVHDGPDEDSTGSTSEVIDSQRRNQMTGNLGSSALETSGMFPGMKASLSRLSIRKK